MDLGFAMEREAIWKRVMVRKSWKIQEDEIHVRKVIGMKWTCRRQLEQDSMSKADVVLW